MTTIDRTRNDEEAVSLLPPGEDSQEKRMETITPLPRFQIFILLIVQIVESITSMSLYPFINQVRILERIRSVI